MGRTVSAPRALLLASVITCFFETRTAWADLPPLTLPQVIEYALKNNGDISSFRQEKGIYEAGRIKAGLPANPTLELEGSTGALTGSSAESNLSLGISQEFFLAGKRQKRGSIADRTIDMYRSQLADRERLLRADVSVAFFDVMLATKRVDLAQKAIALNRQLLQVARDRLAAGDIPELEMNLVMVEVARSEGSAIQAAKELYLNQAKLRMLMGWSGTEMPALTGDLDAGKNAMPSLDHLKQQARNNRPDLKVLEAEKARAEADIVLARAEAVPNLTAGLAFNRESTSMEIGGVEGRDTAYTVGMKLSMPIPVFDHNQAGIQEARAKSSSTESRLSAAVRDMEREVEVAYAGYLNSKQVISLYGLSIIPQLEENLNLTQEAYRLGEVGLLAVIQEQKKFFEVSDGHLSAQHDYHTGRIKLEAAVATELSGGTQ